MSVIMLKANVLSVVILGAFMQKVFMPLCHYAKSRYA
jgi:hypothetical protein